MLVDYVKKYFGDDKIIQVNLLKRMILAYKRYFDVSRNDHEYARGIDLMQFYFEMKDIRQIF